MSRRQTCLIVMGLVTAAFAAPVQAQSCAVSVSPVTRTFPYGGRILYGEIRVSAADDCTWDATASPSWIVLNNIPNSPVVLTGSDTFFYTLEENPNEGYRIGLISVNGVTTKITQGGYGCTYQSPPTVTAPRTGGLLRIPVAASIGSCPWTIETSDSWIAVNSSSMYTGSADAILAVGENFGFTRSTKVVAAGNEVTVVQEGFCSYTLGSTATAAPAWGGVFEVRVTTEPGCGWSVAAAPSWITGVPASGSGSGSIQLVVSPNPGVLRTSDIYIGGQKHNVAQSGSITACTFTVDVTTVSAAYTGVSGSVLLQPNVIPSPFYNCTWAAYS